MKPIVRQTLFLVAIQLCTSVAFAEGGPNTSINGAYVLWPDGMEVSDSIPASIGLGAEGTPQWFRFGAGARRSYSVEIFQLRENGINSPAQATLGAAFSDIAGTVEVTFTDYSFSDPSGGDFNPPVIRRFSMKDLAANTPAFLKIVSALNYETSQTQSFNIRIVDTTLIAPRVTTLGYNAFVALHNSSNQAVTASIHFYDQAGTIIGTTSSSLPARGASLVRFAPKDATYGRKEGSIEVSHDAPPGSLAGTVYMAKAVNGPVAFQTPLQESRSWGRGSN